MSYPVIDQGREGIRLCTGQFYPHSFTLTDLAEFEEFVGEHEGCVWMRDASTGEWPSGSIVIRHDVDHSILHALRFAAWEADHGINSTYFILPTAAYWTQEPVREIALEMEAMGHEIGVHNDSMTFLGQRAQQAGASPTPAELANAAIRQLAEWANEMREWGLSINGCADHGGGEPHNVDMWKPPLNRDPIEAGLLYEAYAEHHKGSNYVSDNHGGWRAPLVRIDGRQTHVLIHPCHWRLP